MPAHFHEDGSITLTGSGEHCGETCTLPKYDEAAYTEWLAKYDCCPPPIINPDVVVMIAMLEGEGVITPEIAKAILERLAKG